VACMWASALARLWRACARTEKARNHALAYRAACLLFDAAGISSPGCAQLKAPE
jgi:hypothetical protein